MPRRGGAARSHADRRTASVVVESCLERGSSHDRLILASVHRMSPCSEPGRRIPGPGDLVKRPGLHSKLHGPSPVFLLWYRGNPIAPLFFMTSTDKVLEYTPPSLTCSFGREPFISLRCLIG